MYCRQEIVYMYIESEKEKERAARESEGKKAEEGTRKVDCIYSHATYACVTRTCTYTLYAHATYILQIRYRIIIKC